MSDLQNAAASDAGSSAAPEAEVRIACQLQGSFGAWLAESGGSLVITTYQAGKVALVGWDGQQVSLLMRDFPKPLGMALAGSRMALVTRHELVLLANAPALAYEFLEDQPGRYDALYLPRASYHTGDLHIHDIAYGEGGLWLVNTRFNCLARLSEEYSFEPVWRPEWITDLVPEDRCHLNGLAMADGRPKYVTALGTTDTPGGWRRDKAQGGVLLEIESGRIVLGGLCMPHSPRWYGNQLWVLNSGRGELLLVNPADGRTMVVCRLPGYLRGLSFVGPFALVGMSKIRETHIFGGLPIQEEYERLECGVAVVDLRDGQVVGKFEFSSGCTELYDVQFLSGYRRPMILNAARPEVRDALTTSESCYWLRPSKEIPTPEVNSADGAPSGAVSGAPPGPVSLARC